MSKNEITMSQLIENKLKEENEKTKTAQIVSAELINNEPIKELALAIPNVKVKNIPKFPNLISITHEVMNTLTNSSKFQERINEDIKVIAEYKIDKKKKKPIYTTFQSTTELNSFDRLVYDAISNLWENHFIIFTPRQLTIKVFNSKTARKISQHQIDLVRNSVKKMQRTIIKLNFEEQAKKYNLSKMTYSTNLLLLGEIQITSKLGELVEGYQIKEIPILLKYAKETGQIATFESNHLFDSPFNQRTETNIKIENYLFKRLLLIKNKGLSNLSIKFQTIYENCDIDISIYDSTNKKKIRNKIIDYLNHHILAQKKDRCYVLKNFEIIKQNNDYYSITLNIYTVEELKKINELKEKEDFIILDELVSKLDEVKSDEQIKHILSIF